MAYYSVKNPQIYHNCKNCNVGDNMVKENLRKGRPKPIKGRGGKIKKPKLCKVCAKLRKEGKGISGIPIPPEIQPGAEVETYYSEKRPEIFHICQNCFLGQNIDKVNLVANKPPIVKKGKEPRLCRICTKLCIAGKGIPGTPIPAGKRTSVYYSKAYRRPKIYHVCRNCYVGNNIEAKYLAAGKPKGAKLCRNCARLRSKGKCVPGIMIPAK
jgi:hypothetical protein